ncbi:hypothetical protein GCM10020331_053030 [Ectobacillus funiculus]
MKKKIYRKNFLYESIQTSNENVSRELENYKAEAEKRIQLLQSEITGYENEITVLKARNENMDGELENYKAEAEKQIQLLQSELINFEK